MTARATAGWEFLPISTADYLALRESDEARGRLLRGVGEAYATKTGKEAVAVRLVGRGTLTGYYCDGDRDPGTRRFRHRGTRRLLAYWHHGVPEDWYVIPISPCMRGRQRGTVRPEVRTWLTQNVARRKAKPCQRWEMKPEGHGRMFSAVAFADQTDASLFRLSWL